MLYKQFNNVKQIRLHLVSRKLRINDPTIPDIILKLRSSQVAKPVTENVFAPFSYSSYSWGNLGSVFPLEMSFYFRNAYAHISFTLRALRATSAFWGCSSVSCAPVCLCCVLIFVSPFNFAVQPRWNGSISLRFWNHVDKKGSTRNSRTRLSHTMKYFP